MIEILLLIIFLIIMAGLVVTPLLDNLFDCDNETEGDE
jgi:hypothetical protein